MFFRIHKPGIEPKIPTASAQLAEAVILFPHLFPDELWTKNFNLPLTVFVIYLFYVLEH